MNKFTEKSGALILGAKISNLPQFEFKKNFPQKMGKTTFTYLLNLKKLEKSNEPITRKRCY